MKHIKLLAGALVALGSVMPGAVFAAPSVAVNQPDGYCKEASLHVSLAPNQAASPYISGTFCYPKHTGAANAVDVLVHGATYDRYYWDSGFNFPDYSYVNRTLQAGRAVFYYDRLGVGKSSPLPSTSVTMYTDAYVLHQIIAHFKPAFPVVNLIGHSYGSRIATLEAAEYNDVSRLVLTDSIHAVGPTVASGDIANKMYTANQDPKFADQNLDDGWITTQPGARGIFYDTATADPNEIAYDDAHKSIFSSTQWREGLQIGNEPAGSNVSNSITAPVLLILGQEDSLYCGLALDCSDPANVMNLEKPYYTSAASLDVKVIPDTGHDLALHPSASTSFAAINDWLR